MVNDSDWVLRATAATSLGKLSDIKTVKILISVLENDTNIWVKRAAAEALEKIGDDRAAETFLTILENCFLCYNKKLTNESLKQLEENTYKDLHEILEKNRQNISEYRTKGDDDRWLRRIAANSIGIMNYGLAGDALTTTCLDDDFWVRRLSADSMEKIVQCDDYWNSKFDEKHKTDTQRLNALKSFEEYIVWSNVESADRMDDTLNSMNKISNKCFDENAVRKLTDNLNEDDIWIRRVAVEELGKINDSRISSILITALEDSDYWVRRIAIESLGKFNDENVLKSLIKALGDSDRWVRRITAQILGTTMEPQTSEEYINRSLSLIKSDVKYYDKLRNEIALCPLIKALVEDDDFWVRRTAAEVFRKTGDKKAVGVLIKALEDKDERVRLIAAEALGRIRDKKNYWTIDRGQKKE